MNNIVLDNSINTPSTLYDRYLTGRTTFSGGVPTVICIDIVIIRHG